MRILISKNQLDLLTKRDAAVNNAQLNAKATQAVALQAAETANQARAAFNDVVTCIVADKEEGKVLDGNIGYQYGTDADGPFLTIMEKPSDLGPGKPVPVPTMPTTPVAAAPAPTPEPKPKVGPRLHPTEDPNKLS